jgi:hypothetical protein
MIVLDKKATYMNTFNLRKPRVLRTCHPTGEFLHVIEYLSRKGATKLRGSSWCRPARARGQPCLVSPDINNNFRTKYSLLIASIPLGSSHEELLEMKRFVTGLPKPCSSSVRRNLLIEDGFSRNTLYSHNVRYSSSKPSRPRTALFFPGMIRLDLCLNRVRRYI